ncbi:TetR/AcrR family transcriptional regulator [Pseudomonas sp. NPDC090202]|uniref:TetR/AcrR family transcriptional regulator n=1 Tax=unclassified Pseudomonas TaxID=196821 RepID=UPI0038246553
MTATDPIAVAPTVQVAAEVLERSYPGARAALKRDILLSALACFNEHGLEPTTIDMIRARCGTSVGNIYHHFGNKEGVVAALFFCALDDLARLREAYLATAGSAREGIAALVQSYVDWVTRQPDLARFQYQARSVVATGPQAEALTERNRQRNGHLKGWLADPERRKAFRPWPPELFLSLIVGPAESYCRAWLAGRVSTPPGEYREELAEAVWMSVAAPV